MANPIEMPSPLPVNSKVFDLNTIQNVTPVGSGFIQTIERVPPMWTAKYETPPLNPDRAGLFQAFLDNLEGSSNSFYAYDPRRIVPQSSIGIVTAVSPTGAYPWVASTSFPPIVFSSNYVNSTLELRNLAPGYKFKAGDYISYKVNNEWRLYRLTTNFTVPGNGIYMAPVRPRPKSFLGAPTLRIYKAACAMKMLGSYTKSDKVDDIGPTFSFQAAQFVDRATA